MTVIITTVIVCILVHACRTLAKQRREASALHQRFISHDASLQLAEQPAAQRKAAAAAVRAYANVWFTCEDFASSEHTPQSLDTIMCLSMTKWVHLNQGDEGLKRLFVKVKDALVPGGCFILEPQPWKSYKQARRKQVCTASIICLEFLPKCMLHVNVCPGQSDYVPACMFGERGGGGGAGLLGRKGGRRGSGAQSWFI